MRATRPLFWFCGGTPPTPPRHGGFAPLDPPFCPPSLAEGLPGFWAPLVAGLLMRATRPLFWFCGGTPPTPWGLRPPGPPVLPMLAEGLPGFWAPLVAGLLMRATRPLFCTPNFGPPFCPRGLRVRQGLGPTHGGVANAGYSPPLLVLWGDTPHAPLPWGLCPPCPPILPALVGLGFARVLGPTRGGVANAGYSPPLFYFGGTSPKPPARGLRPLDPRFAHPRWLRVCQVFLVPLVAGLLMRATRPLFWFCGGTPPKPPARGLRPPGPPLPTPVGLGFASVLGPTQSGFARG